MTTKKSKKESTLYYFHSIGCAFCKQIDPIIEKLNKEGYDILRLDVGETDNNGLHKEVQEKYKIDCGTPLLIDVDSGNYICGYRGSDIIKKWADGEQIPEILKPKSPPPPPPQNYKDENEIEDWKEKFKNWKQENNHLLNLPKTDVMLNNLKNRNELLEKQKEMNPLELKIYSLEKKLDRLMNHLGVK